MCGLCGYATRGDGLAHDAQERLTDALLLAVNHRGGDATGFVSITAADEPWLLKAPMDAKRFTAGRPNLPTATRAMIGHTRLATQGAREWAFNNHPVRVGDTYLAHNGHVYNQIALATLAGLKPVQGVDSAVLAALVETAPGGPIGALDLFHNVEGAAAVTYWNPRKAPGAIVLARLSGSPLYVWEGRRAVVWASTLEAVRESWAKATNGAAPTAGRVKALGEGEARVIHADGRVDTVRFRAPDPWQAWRPAFEYGRPWHGVKGTVSAVTGGTRTATKGKAKGRAKGKRAPSQAPAQSRALATVSIPDDAPWMIPDDAVWTQDGALAHDAQDRGLHMCDSCQDFYTRVERVDIGGETFRMCASCAAWAQEAIWGEGVQAHLTK